MLVNKSVIDLQVEEEICSKFRVDYNQFTVIHESKSSHQHF